MASKVGAPYLQFALRFRDFLESHDLNPTGFHSELVFHMRKNAPSLSTVYAAFYGNRPLPFEVILFMQERLGFKLKWRDAIPVRNIEGGEVKRVQYTLPGLRELSR